MTHRIAGVAVLAAAFAAAPAAAQQAVLLRFTPPVGQVSHYRSVSQTWMQIPGFSAGDTSAPTMTQTVYSTETVSAMDGPARVITTTTDSSQREMPGMPGMASGDLLRGMVRTQHIDPRGQVLSAEVTPPPGANPMFAARMRQSAHSRQGTLPMPAQAVRPGDTWTDSLDIPLGAGPRGSAPTWFHLTYKLERLEERGGARVAVVSMDGHAGAGAGAADTMHGEYTIDLGASRLLSLTSDLSAHVQGQEGTIPIRVHAVTELQP